MTTKSVKEREAELQEKIENMPEAYQTPQGRIVRANPILHEMVVRQRGGYEGYKACEMPKAKAPAAKKAAAKKAPASEAADSASEPAE